MRFAFCFRDPAAEGSSRDMVSLVSSSLDTQHYSR